MIPAILKVKFKVNEILVSLMLIYVAEQILALASLGFLRNPDGAGFLALEILMIILQHLTWN